MNGNNGDYWYHEPWAWLVFGIPVGTVVACIIMITIAASTSDGLVVDDYYKQGLEINKVLDREARAAALGLELERLTVTASDYAFTLRGSDSGYAFPAELDVLFAHATRGAASDQATLAEHLGGGHYRGRLAPLSQGPWYLEVATGEWRIMRRVVIGSQGRRP